MAMNKPTKQMVLVVQAQLNDLFDLNLKVDGIIGQQTMAAALRISTISAQWSLSRQFVGAIQHICFVHGLDAGPIDGYWGPLTENGFDELVQKLENNSVVHWREQGRQPVKQTPNNWGWPNGNTKEMIEFFGPVGTNQSRVPVPYTLKLAWDTDTTLDKFTCHKKVVEPIQQAMENILNVYGLDFIQENKLDYWGGCLNVRKKRGGSSWSMHSWGTAIDWNPMDNRLRWGSDKAQLARPEFEQFWQAWERVGAQSLGRKYNFDYMHVEFNT